jgi:hypothetical protein
MIDAQIGTQLEELRAVARQRIIDAHLAGRDTRHNRMANLRAIQSVVESDPHYTWDIAGVERFGFDEILGEISSITQCSSDPSVKTGGGYISPDSTLEALEEASKKIAFVARRNGTFVLGTGHPGSLLAFYIRVARLIREWGGKVLEPARGSAVPPNLDLDYVEGVAVTTDRASLMHSHAHRAMELMLDSAGKVDLAFADHGYAAGAITAGVPVISAMDTNDPALALAKRLGANLIIIPMDDNRPMSVYLPIVDVIRGFGEHFYPDLRKDGPSAGANGMASAEQARLAGAEQMLAARMDSDEGLDELVRSLIEGYCDQIFQTGLEPDEHDDLSADPYLELALYRRFHRALHRAVLRRMDTVEMALRPQQVTAYLDRPADGA